MQAGGKLSVRLRAAKPDGQVVRAAAIAEFYRPGKDPEHQLADRIPDRQVPLSFDAASRTYGAEVSTTGWLPGDWTLRGSVLDASGVPSGWGWSGFTLEA
jgi:hypothetical protein